jgi:hypothetical protein
MNVRGDSQPIPHDIKPGWPIVLVDRLPTTKSTGPPPFPPEPDPFSKLRIVTISTVVQISSSFCTWGSAAPDCWILDSCISRSECFLSGERQLHNADFTNIFTFEPEKPLSDFLVDTSSVT